MAELPTCCPILEQTADGKNCGRCWSKLDIHECPRHGDVSVEQVEFSVSGKCTLENAMRKRKGLPLLGPRG